MADVEIYWTGLECQVKQETPDDQIYGSIQVIAATAPLPAIPFPDEKWVSLGPEGQRIYAPNQLIYSGNLKPITVAATLAESDSGDCEDEKRAVSGALSDAARSALNGYIPGAGEMSKKVLDLLAKSVVNYFADDVLGVGDDVYNPQGIALDEEALVTANARRQMLRRDDDPHSLQWTDVIVLSGTDDGGDYGQYGIYLDVRPSKAAVLAHSISKHAAKDLSKLPGQTLQLGSSGPDVSRLQQLLNQKISDLAPLTVDGAFGAVTAARVREFQHRAGITVDGVVGPQTWGTLLGDSSTRATGTSSATLQLGSSGPDVSRLQQLLNQKISDLAPLTVDGAFGAVTAARVREFQHRAGITVDGVVGPQTWGILQIP